MIRIVPVWKLLLSYLYKFTFEHTTLNIFTYRISPKFYIFLDGPMDAGVTSHIAPHSLQKFIPLSAENTTLGPYPLARSEVKLSAEYAGSPKYLCCLNVFPSPYLKKVKVIQNRPMFFTWKYFKAACLPPPPHRESAYPCIARLAGPTDPHHRQSMTCFQIQRDTGLWYSAEYSSFSVGPEADKYRLSVSGLVVTSKFFHIPKGPSQFSHNTQS